MEKLKKWHFYLSFIALGLLACLFTSAPAEALGFVGTTDHIITSGGFGRPMANNTLEILYPVNRSGNDVWVNIPGAYSQNITAMNLNVSTPIPANSLVSFSISYDYLNDAGTGIKYYGLQFEHNRSLLYDSCENIIGQNLYVANSGTHITWTCTYVFYNQDQTSIIDSSYGSHIFERIQPTDNLIDVLNIVIGPASSVQLTNNGLSANDRAWLESVIPDATSVGQIEQGVKDAMDSVEDEQQAKYEQQAEDNEDDIDAASSAAQSTATSLTSVLTQFLGILTSAQPTNCVLNGDLMPHLPLGQLDLCQNSPPAAITALGSLILIAFVVPLAYHLVKRMLALIGSFQS